MGRSDGNSKRSRSPRWARPCGSSSTQAPGPNLAAAVRGQRSDPVLSRLKRTLRHSKVERPAGHHTAGKCRPRHSGSRAWKLLQVTWPRRGGRARGGAGGPSAGAAATPAPSPRPFALPGSPRSPGPSGLWFQVSFLLSSPEPKPLGCPILAEVAVRPGGRPGGLVLGAREPLTPGGLACLVAQSGRG